MFTERRNEIERMLRNEFIQRKDKLIKDLETSRDAEKYLIKLKKEEEKYYIVTESIKTYYN